jgi:uncharacterized protein (TIGR02118 family)
MVRLLVVYDTPKDIEAFEHHYRAIHVPLAKKLLGLRRFTISRNPSRIRGGEPYFLVAELDWDNMTALQLALESPEGKATADDVPKFANAGVRSMVYELEEV